MSWNYRVIEHEWADVPSYSYTQIHEVYYDENGEPLWMTENACAPYGDTEATLAECFSLMQGALEKPILKATIFDNENNSQPNWAISEGELKMDIRVQVYQHKKTGAIRVADHPPGQLKDWSELYTFMHETVFLLDNTETPRKKPNWAISEGN